MARKPQPTPNKPCLATMGHNRWPLALLVLAVVTVFSQVCIHEFLVYDDNHNIYQNELVTTFTPANLIHFWKKPFAGMYIPLTYNFWSVQAKVASLLPATGQGAGLNPYLFHTVNLLLHLANACLVFSIIRRLVKNEWAILLGALLFAVHPVQVEPAAWVTGCKDLLSAFFSLLALGRYINYAQAQAVGKGGKGSYLLALIFLLASLLAKPSAVVMPLVAGGIGLLLHRSVKQLAYDLAPWAVLALPIVIITKMAQPYTRHEFLPTLWQRLLISGDSLSFYLLKLIAPLNLGPDYGRTPQFVLQHDWVYLTGLIPYLLAVAIIWKAMATYRAAAGIFVFSLLPVLGISTFTFQLISTVADRYLYLAMLGPALAASWFLSQAKGRATWGIAMAILVLFGIKSATQVPIWGDSIAFTQHAITINPQSWTAYGNLGNAKADRNQQEEAIAFYKKALSLKPDDEKTTFNLGVSYGILNQTEEAIAAFLKTVELIRSDNNKDQAYKTEAIRDVYVNLGVVYGKNRRTNEAIDSFLKAIATDPGFVFSYASLGDLYIETGQTDKAVTMYQQALALDPFSKGVHGNLGLLLAEQGNLAAAVNHFNKALAQTPDDLPLRLTLGIALYQQQDFAGASRQLLQVTQTDQAPVEISVEAYSVLGAVYMAQGNWQQASDALRTVLRYAPDHQDAKDNLQKVVDEMKKLR